MVLTRREFVVSWLFSLGAGSAGGAPRPFERKTRIDPTADLRELQGAWDIVSSEPPTIAGHRMVISGDRVQWYIGKRWLGHEMLRLEPGHTPKWIDLTPLDSALARV
jgi:hypothetical protein